LFKSSTCDDDEERDKHMGVDLVVDEETIETYLGYDNHIVDTYPKSSGRSLAKNRRTMCDKI
jgi:hypothetical protein